MTSQIQLHNSAHQCKVDAIEMPRLSSFNWHSLNGSSGIYARATINGKTVLMHRLLMGALKGQTVDHINGDTLDNRRENLRFASSKQNAQNSRAKGLSGLNGVKQKAGCWIASITPNGKQIYLGTYPTKEKAAAVYDAAAKVVYQDFARCNYKASHLKLLDGVMDMKRAQIQRLQEELSVLGGANGINK